MTRPLVLQLLLDTVHNATVCVDFVKNDTFLGTSFVDNLPKSCYLFAFSPTNLLQIYSISFKKVPLKLQGLLKLKHFDSQATNFGPVLPNSRKRLRNFYHSIGEIKIVLFLKPGVDQIQPGDKDSGYLCYTNFIIISQNLSSNVHPKAYQS